MDADKFKGVLFGQAIGDALGLCTEFMTKGEVRHWYPDGVKNYSQMMVDYHRARWQPGDWTDDTDMMLCIAEAVIKDKELNSQSVAQNFKKWFLGCPKGIGRHTYNVLSLGDYVKKPHRAAELVWQMSGRRNAANGAVMRTSVIGLLNEEVEKHAADICRLTHADPRCVGSAVIVSQMVHALVYRNELLPLEELIEIGRQYDERIEPYLLMVRSETLNVLNLDDEAMGYTLKTMAAGLWSVYHAGSFEEGLLEVVNAGGDADTNGAVAGSLLGARFGYSNIPTRYVDGLVRKDALTRVSDALQDVLKG